MAKVMIVARQIPLSSDTVSEICIELLDADFFPHDLHVTPDGSLSISGSKICYSFEGPWILAIFRRQKAIATWQLDIESVTDCQLCYGKHADRKNSHECAGGYYPSDNMLVIETHSGLTINVTVDNLSGQLRINDAVQAG